MSTSLRRLTCPSLALLLMIAGCSDDGGRTSESADSTAGSSPTSISGEPTGSGSSGTGDSTPTQAGTMTEAGSGSDSLTGTGSGDTTQGTGPTTGTSQTSGGTTTDTTGGGVCAEEMKCAGKCCGAGDLCDNGECVPDCGGPPPCGDAKECCDADDLCYLGECVTPGPACDEQVCATKPLQNVCGDGFVCDPQQELCLPSKADPTCQYVPPPNVFKPEPLFTWGRRKVIACVKDTDCQVAEVCTAKVCTPTWKHWFPGADDMPNHYQSSAIPVVVDIDDNCVPDIIFNTYTGPNAGADGVVRAIRGDTGEKLWTISDPAYRTNSTSNLAVGDIDGDGPPEILADGEGKRILAFKGDGTPLWKSDPYTGADSSGSVAIADMDGEGSPEIIFGAAIFSNAGKKVYEGAVGIGRNGQGPISCAADLDGDGRPELIGGRTAYKTTGTVAGNDFKGAVLWTNAATDGFCGVADFDPDGQPEVVLVTMGKVLILNGLTGVTRATANIPNGGTGGPPNVADFDGDGLRDIGVAGSARCAVFQFDAKTNKMSQLWTAATEDDSSQVTGSSVFDFNGDLAA